MCGIGIFWVGLFLIKINLAAFHLTKVNEKSGIRQFGLAPFIGSFDPTKTMGAYVNFEEKTDPHLRP